jgi:hypothetical protein
MRLFLVASALLVSCWLLPAPATAQEGVHRCIGPDGTPLFTDQPCAALKATPVQAAPKSSTAPAPNAPPPSAPPPILCASTVAELRQSVTDAFATRDPNRLAGLMLWEGAGRNAVVADIRTLSALMKRPLLDFGEQNAADQAAADPDAPPAERPAAPPEHQLVVHTAADDGSGTPRETRFDIVRRSGCLWLRSAG